jgi:hypothetical protein
VSLEATFLAAIALTAIAALLSFALIPAAQALGEVGMPGA